MRFENVDDMTWFVPCNARRGDVVCDISILFCQVRHRLHLQTTRASRACFRGNTNGSRRRRRRRAG